MEADGGERGYVYFHDPTCHRDFSGTIFLIFKIFNNFLIFFSNWHEILYVYTYIG